jgi:protein tyrosine phosphatase
VLEGEGNAQQQVSVHYIHHPIQDLSVPSNSKNLKLLLWKLLDFLDSGDATESMVYVHCWGGRGRAGLTACCMLTLLEFAATSCGEIDGNNITDVQTIFDVVQTGYASRLGSENIFYEEVQEEANARASRD